LYRFLDGFMARLLVPSSLLESSPLSEKSLENRGTTATVF